MNPIKVNANNAFLLHILDIIKYIGPYVLYFITITQTMYNVPRIENIYQMLYPFGQTTIERGLCGQAS